MSISFGVLGFIFYFIYDVNSVCWKNKWLQKFFLCGTCLISLSTISIFLEQAKFLQFGTDTIIWGIAAAVFFLLLIYTLFFAIPFKETYMTEQSERKAYTEGIYALCRHPGVLWFAGFYASLACITGGNMWVLTIVLTGLNFLYILFQDIWTFPRIFSNYEEYQKSTPFLLPDRKSIRYCIKTLRR